MVKMSNKTQESESDDDAVTSSDYSDSSDDESSDHNRDDASDTTSYRSLAFSVKKNRSTAIVKSKKSKKRVRFKPGDSLVLIYVIPNREMLGLKSDSESSDYGDSDDDSDDEDDDEEDNDNDDDDDQEDDDEDDDDDGDDDDDEDDDSDGENGNRNKSKKDKKLKQKPFAKLLAVRQVQRRKFPDLRSNIKKTNDNSRTINLDVNSNQINLKRKQRLKPTKKEKKEVPKPTKKDLSAISKSSKQSKMKKNKTNAIKGDVIKPNKSKRNRSRLLEIRATVEPVGKSQETSGSKLMYKHDIKPNIIDVNGAVSMNSSTPLTNRTRLQPTSFRITKSRPNSGTSKSANGLSERPAKVAQVVSANYESLTSVLPSSYINLSALQNKTVDETIKRLDPESMNTSGKKSYAWQVANGTISSQALRTPSILPFLDSLQNSVSENNTLKLPT